MQPYHLWGPRGPTPPVPSFGLWPNDRPGGHRPPSYFLCEQKVTKKSLEPGVPDLPLGASPGAVIRPTAERPARPPSGGLGRAASAGDLRTMGGIFGGLGAT